MISVTRLNIFLHVANAHSFSVAAQQLHLTQPTVSKHINTLEKELSAKLLERKPHGVHLTDAGKTLLPWARKLVNDNHDLQNMMGAIDQDVSGQLRIVCSTTTGKYILPQLAARFRKKNPSVRISILQFPQGEISKRLMSEEADLGVANVELNRGGLECQFFFTDHIILIAPNTHPWAKLHYIEPEKLIKEPIILRESSSGVQRVLQAELAKHDISIEDLNVHLEVGNAEAIILTISTESCVSFVSRMASANARTWGQVVEVPVKGFNLQQKVCIGRKSNGPPSRARDAFWNFIHTSDNFDLFKLSK